jgi:hypothetical protein
MSEVDVYVTRFGYADYTPNPVAKLNTAITNLTVSRVFSCPMGSMKRAPRRFS